MADEHDDKGMQKPQLASDAFERELTTDLDDETPDKPKGMALHTRILIGLAAGVVAGITINALVILTPDGESFRPEHTNPPGGLEKYFQDNVIGGPGSFTVVAESHAASQVNADTPTATCAD